MNRMLANIYGTSHEKTASAGDELDLDNMSAQDLIQGLDDGSIVFDDEGEKTAGGFDLSQMSAAELIALSEEADEMDNDDTIEKMASDGSLDYFDTAGRIMAHAYADEMGKVASDDGDIEVNLHEISGEDLMHLMEDGYEFVGQEKTAAFTGPMRRLKSGKLSKAQKEELQMQMRRQMNQTPDRGADAADAYRKKERHSSNGRTARGLSIEAAMRARGARDSASEHFGRNKNRYAGGTAALGTAGAAGGGYAYMKRKK